MKERKLPPKVVTKYVSISALLKATSLRQIQEKYLWVDFKLSRLGVRHRFDVYPFLPYSCQN